MSCTNHLEKLRGRNAEKRYLVPISSNTLASLSMEAAMPALSSLVTGNDEHTGRGGSWRCSLPPGQDRCRLVAARRRLRPGTGGLHRCWPGAHGLRRHRPCACGSCHHRRPRGRRASMAGRGTLGHRRGRGRLFGAGCCRRRRVACDAQVGAAAADQARAGTKKSLRRRQRWQ